ncbi:phage tail assembly protein T [Pandoraea bronchicola]|uniref:Minor tail T domain-containing protein n=1 Tax=Pandoraea bronchicola TaxID=2508287 RepID=A0A5E5BX64_9BURK|nr:DUF4035 domain-containing protein [Pandoraea bronchicola]VVE90399.1 hypothetical protein PBR20603_04383 [Pandoraea bronchicola]
MSVRQAQREIDSAEFAEWVAYSRIEQFGSPIEDLRTGAVVSMLANINRDRKRHPEPFGLLDVLPWAEHGDSQPDEPVQLADPKAQSDLIRAAIFGIAPTSD